MLSFNSLVRANEANNEFNRHSFQNAGDESSEEEEEEEEGEEEEKEKKEEENDDNHSEITVPITPSIGITISQPEMRKVNTSPSFKYLENNDQEIQLDKKNEKNIEFILELADQFNRRTITDFIQDEIRFKLFNVTFVIFTFVYLIVKSFGETQYILLNIGVYLIIWLFISNILIEQLLFVANDFHSGWNYYLKLGNSVVTQILFLVTLSLIYEQIKGNASIHPSDAVFFFVLYLIQWMTLVFYFLILVHFTEQLWFFIQCINHKKNS